MTRSILAETQIHPTIRQKVSDSNAAIVGEVKAAVAAHAIVVVGMGLNPFPRKARKILDGLGTPYHYLGYGSYLSKWRPRSALKMWTGWGTFPMVFVNGMLIGGATELQALIERGELAGLLKTPA